MISVITGDITHSRKVSNPEVWMQPLKGLFTELGTTPKVWEIYRGDSFQAETAPEEALSVAFRIKAIVKSVKQLDVRMAIGIGNKTYEAPSVTESSGDAHIFSGESFEELKKEKNTLIIKSQEKEFNEEFNMLLKLALIIIDNWSTTSAETAQLVLQNPHASQKELARQLKISQPSVSARYNRANLHEILELLAYFKKRVQKIRLAE